MRNFKRIIIALLALAMTLSLFSCKDNKEEAETISFFDYAIVRPEKTSSEIKDGVSKLYMLMMEKSGKDSGLGSDNLYFGEEPDANAKEILVGHTNRPETEQVLSQLASDEFAVAIVGNKLVITGIVESLTPYAIDYFIENYLGDGSEGKVAADLFYKGTTDTVVLVDKGEPIYTVVRPEYAFEGTVDKCLEIYDVIYDVSGVSIPVKTDELFGNATHDESAPEILVGEVSYEMMNDIKGAVAPDGYLIDFVGSKIIIYSWSAEGISKALDAFKDMLTFGCYIDAEGKATVCVIKEKITGTVDSLGFYTDVPLEAGGRAYDGVYNASDKTMMLYWRDANDDMLKSYASELEAGGFTLHQSLDNDSVHSVTYFKDDVEVCAYLFKRTGELRATTQENVKIKPVNPYEYEKICEPCVVQMCSYNLYHEGAVSDMGYLIRLEDGTFVIIDGGLGGGYWESHVQDIYNKMVELKPEGVDEIVISAWFLTHGHGDHFGVLQSFIKSYSNLVKVKMFLANDMPSLAYELADKSGGFNYSSVNGKFGGCSYVKVHTGQQFFFPGATFTILSTQEDVYPDTYTRYNSYAAMIFDSVIGGKRFMWLGDAEWEKSPSFISQYREDLKSDVVQMAHHGATNTVTPEVYQLIDPTEVFWPIMYSEDPLADGHMTFYGKVAADRWVVDHVGWENVYIGGEGYYTMWFDSDSPTP